MAEKTRSKWYDACCTFEGLGPQKDEYMRKLEAKLGASGFRKIERLSDQWLSDYFVGSDLVYGFSKPFKIGFVFRLVNGNLLVGYLLHAGLGNMLKLFPIALIVIILNLVPDWLNLPFYPFAIPAFVLGLVGIYQLFWRGFAIPYRQWIKPLGNMLVEVAESMGGKQLTSFKRTKIDE